MKNAGWNRGIRFALALLFVAGATQLCAAQSSNLRASKSTAITVRVLGSVGLSSGAAVLSATLPSASNQSQAVYVPANVRWNLGRRDIQSFEVVQYVSGSGESSRRIISTEQRKGDQQTSMHSQFNAAEPGPPAGLLNVEVRLY